MHAKPTPTTSHKDVEALEYTFSCANPRKLIDDLRTMRRCRNDADLCRILGISPPTISRIRTGKMPVSAAIVLRIHEVFGVPVADLRRMIAQ